MAWLSASHRRHERIGDDLGTDDHFRIRGADLRAASGAVFHGHDRAAWHGVRVRRDDDPDAVVHGHDFISRPTARRTALVALVRHSLGRCASGRKRTVPLLHPAANSETCFAVHGG